MRTRFKSDIDCARGQQRLVTHTGNGVDLGMSLATAAVKPLANYPAVMHHHSAHHGIRRGVSPTLPRQLQCPAHISLINIHNKEVGSKKDEVERMK